jgi:hypothetical protein
MCFYVNLDYMSRSLLDSAVDGAFMTKYIIEAKGYFG